MEISWKWRGVGGKGKGGGKFREESLWKGDVVETGKRERRWVGADWVGRKAINSAANLAEKRIPQLVLCRN